MLLDYRPALRERTGVGEYVHEAACHLVATTPSAEAIVLFSASWRDRLTPGIIPGAAVIDRAVPVSLLNFAWHRLGWPPVERLAGARFDVVQSMHPLLIPSRRAARLVTIHDLDFLDHPERAEREIRRDYPALAQPHAVRADHIVVNSRHTAQAVSARFGIDPARISVCAPGAPAWPRRTAEPSTGACVLFLGSVTARKNPGALLDAYERLIARHPAAPPLALVGRISDDAGDIVERVRRAPLEGRVHLPGYVDAAARLGWFRRALVFVLPSHAEGFGIPVLEAMTAGVPVIAANRGALPEVVGSAGRLVDPDEPETLAAALADILTNPSLRARMADEGARQARQFTWASTAAHLREAWALALEYQRRRHA